MDDADRAQAREEFIREASLRAFKNRLEEHFKISGADECVDCGDPISAERRKAVPSTLRCAGCQGDHEKRTMWGK